MLSHLDANLLPLLPADEIDAYLRERDGARREVIDWLPIVQRLADAPRGDRGRTIAALAASAGVSPSAIRKRYDRWRRHGWRGLINRSKYPDARANQLPKAFTEWVAGLYERYQRNNGGKQVHRYLLDRWARWTRTLAAADAIPGYRVPPPPGPDGYPAGWSYKTITRLRPPSVNLLLTRQGRKAASMELPGNYTTRAGLLFGQRVFFDDQEYDLKVNHLVNKTALRPKGFNALEQLSGAFLDYTAIVTHLDAVESTVRHLRQKDFVWFVIRYLMRWGYRTDTVGTELIFEHGTATGYNNQLLTTLPYHNGGHDRSHHSFDAALAHLTGDRVTVNRSGRFNDPAFSGMLFRPQSTGNFRFKAPLESMFNLVRNHMAALPGPQGMHRDASPEENAGLDTYNTQLLSLYAQLPPERAQLLLFPYLSFGEFTAILHDLYHLINTRTDHALEGWDRCGFVRPCYRLDQDQPWQPRENLLAIADPDRRQAVADLADWRPQNLSPYQVAEAYKRDLTKLRPELVPYLLPTQWAYDLVVNKRHELHLSDPQDFPGSRAMFLAQVPTRDGRETLAQGTKLRGYWHPMLDRLWLCRADGSFLGILEQFQVPTAGDTPAIVRNQGPINSIAADIRRDSAHRGGGLAAARQDMQRHNADLADPDKPATPDDKKAHRKKQRARQRLEKDSHTTGSRTGMTRKNL